MPRKAWFGLPFASVLVAVGLAAEPIEDQILTTTLTLPQSLEWYSSSRCVWAPCSLGPRLYLAPRTDGSYLVGWTDNYGNGHVSTIAGSSIASTDDYQGRWVRGLVAHGDGTYAVLLKDPINHILYLSKRTSAGGQIWITNLNHWRTEDSSNLGDHRLAYGAGRYAAYWAVHGIDGSVAGHEGDQLQYVSDSGELQAGGWTWGCSHSMAELVGYHPGDQAFTSFCSTDCYPDFPSLRMNHFTLIQRADGDCRSGVSLQLGQMAVAETGWKVIFTAQDSDATETYGIGFATAGGNATTDVVWLTNTEGRQERDPVAARIGSQTPARYLVGWKTQEDRVFHIGIVNDNGAFLEGPEALSATGPGWGNRDDSFTSRFDGSVVWLQGAAGSTSLYLHRYTRGGLFSDGFEGGNTGGWSSTSS